MKKVFIILIMMAAACSQADQQQASEPIKINQLGYYPMAPKVAVVPAGDINEFVVIDASSNQEVLTGELSPPRTSSFSGKKVQLADFSSLELQGSYLLKVGNLTSGTFKVDAHIYQDLSRAALKTFYFQRASTALPEEFAGKWKRPAGHPDDQVKFHPATGKSADIMAQSTHGWYDAGDYGKYIVNSGITTATLLSLYEELPDYMGSISLNIPESNDEIPDILNEVYWNLQWMLSMQDPEDGGVYHKMTTANFEGFVMPEEAKSQRYFMPKSTAATYDFAAVMAQSARVYQPFLPEFAEQCKESAFKALAWANENPTVLYDQNQMNEDFDPDVNTGAYGDRNVEDESFWAHVEFYLTSGDQNYLDAVADKIPEGFSVPAWPNVKALGYYSLARFPERTDQDIQAEVKSQIIKVASDLINNYESTAYHTVMGKEAGDFIWGSNSLAANQAIVLLQAFQLSQDQKYWEAALHNFDYLLGRNATGYSFVTGFGHNTPMHIHHRPSAADEIDEPVPGFLVGGPNGAQQDDVKYPNQYPDESYVDVTGSYASNEIAINWNAPFVYTSFMLEYLQESNGL